MHGSSSVPQEWLKIIDQFGGAIPETYGVPVEEIAEGIKNGVRKVNIDTDLRMASTGAIRRFLAENPKNFDPRKYLGDRHQGHEGDLRGALRGLRYRRQRQQDPSPVPGSHAAAL
jgi:fructose/tagatose bisphosphate aldolase